MIAPRFEATPVPVRGCGISPHELRWIVHQERRLGIPRPAPHIIDLTGYDDDDDDDEREPLVHNQNDPFLTSHFASLTIRPRVARNPNPTFQEIPPCTQASSSRRVPHPAQADSPRSKKRKESESGEEGDETESGLAKRRLRPKKYVDYADRDDSMDLDEPEEDLMESIEIDGKDDSAESDGKDESDDTDDSEESDTEVWEVKRVVAEKKGRRIHEFLLDWVGSDEQNWIPAKRCHCKDLIADFRAVPRVSADTPYLAALERERLRRAENVRRTGALRPQNVMHHRDPRTGRFTKKRVNQPQPDMELEIPDSEAEDESDAGLDGSDNDASRSPEANIARIPWDTPSPGPFDSSLNDFLRFMSPSPPQPVIQLQNQTEEIVWVRKTLINDNEVPPEKLSENSKATERPMQTAKVTWTRNTPGFEDEQSSFMRSEGTVVFTSKKSKISHTSPTPPSEAVGSLAVKSVSPKLPQSPVRAHGFTSINSDTSQSLPTFPQKAARWMAIKSNPVSSSSYGPLEASGVTTKKPNTTQTASFSPPRKSASLPAKLDLRVKSAQPKISAMAQGTKSRSRSPRKASRIEATSSTPQPSFTNPIQLPGRATSAPNAAQSFSARSSPQNNTQSAMQQPNASAQSSRSRVETVHTSVSGIARGRQSFSSTSPVEASTSPMLKPTSAQPLRSSIRYAIPTNSKPVVKVSQPAVFSWSPPASPVKSTSTKNFSPKPIFKIAPPTTSGMARSAQSSSSRTPVRDTGTKSLRSESAPTVPRPLSSGLPRKTQSSSSPGPARDASTTLATPESLANVAQPVRSGMAETVQGDVLRRFVPDTAGVKKNLHPQKAASGQNSPQDSTRKVPKYHGFGLDTPKKSSVNVRSSAKGRAKVSVFKSQGSARRKGSIISPKRKKIARKLDRLTSAIEAEIASNPGLHCISKKNVAAVLKNASMNASRRPDVSHRVQSEKTDCERSPSVATQAFIAGRERERLQRQAPSGVRPEVNRDFGPHYPAGLCLVAKRWEAANIRKTQPTFQIPYRHRPETSFKFSFSNDTPLPSIEQ